jgi:hypothetical protein
MGFTLGAFHFEAPRQEYDAWLERIEGKVSADPDQVIKELKRRLGLK